MDVPFVRYRKLSLARWNKQVEKNSAMPKKAASRKPNLIKQFFSLLGPGLITGAADDDPSGIATYSIAGAQMGTAMLPFRRLPALLPTLLRKPFRGKKASTNRFVAQSRFTLC